MMRRWSTMDPRDINKVAAEPSIPPERLLRLTEVVQYRLVIADDHPLFRGALREAVEGLLEQVDIAEAGTFDELVELLERGSEVDLVLLDLTMPGARGFSGLMYMRAQYPGVPVIVVSANDDPAAIRRCMEFGASGFIPKTLGVEAMRAAISRILNGGVWTPPDVDLSAGSDAEIGGADGAHGDFNATTGSRADDVIGRASQQADRLPARRIRGDSEGACLRHSAEARGRKPHASSDCSGQDRSWAMAANSGR